MQIGIYKISEQLGRGGGGVVLKGVDAKLDRTVAIKLLHEQSNPDPQILERFLREARAMAKVSHAHVVQVYAADEHEGQPYLAMEFIDGTDLSRLLKDRKTVTPALAVEWIRQAAEGLAAAHEAGLIHRDIKPGNLLLTSKGQIKVSDFGIAIAQLEPATRLTSHGNVVGTPGYLSPEACLGQKTDARSDIYGLGVVLFELIVGARPFLGETPLSIMLQVAHHDAPDIRSLDGAHDPAIAELIARMLARDPNARFQSALELANALSRWQAQNSDVIPNAGPVQSGPHYPGLNSSSGRANTTNSRLNLLSEARIPTLLTFAFALSLILLCVTGYWLTRDMYLAIPNSVYDSSATYASFNSIKLKLLLMTAAAVICLACFSQWLMRTHRYLRALGAPLTPKNEKWALFLFLFPPINLWFSWQQWHALRNATGFDRSSTLIGFWWGCYFGAIALQIAAYWVLPHPLAPGSIVPFGFTLSLFGFALWFVAGLLTLWLMLLISLKLAKQTG